MVFLFNPVSGRLCAVPSVASEAERLSAAADVPYQVWSLHHKLRMSREEIGNYLGLTIESISRLLSKFKKEGLLRVSNREIELLDPVRLKAITAGTHSCN